MSADAKQEDFEQTPEGWQKLWTVEFAAARKFVEKFHTKGDKVIKRFLDDREGAGEDEKNTRWSFFWANIVTQLAMLYGQTPKVVVTRKYADANDSIARVAGELLERVLNCDIQREGDNYASTIRYCLEDRLLPGLGSAKARYVEDSEEEQVEPIVKDGKELAPGFTKPKKNYEDVETDYVHWRDELWPSARTYHELRWRAWRAEMSRPEMAKRFGDAMAELVPLNAKRNGESSSDEDAQRGNPWARAEVWEIWSREHKKRFFYVEGFSKILEEKDDPTELEGFYPAPRPMFANVTTSKLMPKSDYEMAQDIYRELDTTSGRINLLVDAVQVKGAYDSTAEGLQNILKDCPPNTLIPVSNWAMFAEKGGIKGVIDWLPLDQIVEALDKLREYRTELVGALYQITGMNDIMRGQAQTADVTATEQSLKARFASVRLQALQDEFARFASDLQNIRAQLICKFFDPQTILERSNAANMFDADTAMQAIQLLKSDVSCYRIEVKPEAVSMTDFAQLKAERTEFLTAVSAFFQNSAPLVQAMPGALPFLLEILKWSVAGIRGSSEIEGVLDKAIQQANAAQQQQAANPQAQQPDPKVQQIQLKAQADLQKTQADLQAHLIGIQAETQANNQRQRDQTAWNVREQEMRARIKKANDPGPAPTFSEPDMGGQQ